MRVVHLSGDKNSARARQDSSLWWRSLLYYGKRRGKGKTSVYDVLIRDVKIIDGTGSPWFKGDVAIKDGRIAAMGSRLSGEAREEVAGLGRVLAPGFVDIHSHSDFSLPIDGGAESRLLQGVTTEIGGNCGLSPAPVVPERLDLLKKYAGFLTQSLSWDWESFGEYLDAVEKAEPAVNFASLVGHGTLRVAAMGFDNREPSAEELLTMKRLLSESMKEGALGLSSGLIYPPGFYSTTQEIAEIAKAMTGTGGYYETHMRNEGEAILRSIEESAQVGRQANVPVLVAHHKIVGRMNWGLSRQSQAMIEDLRREGLDIACDQYPYTAGSTTITTIFPQWAHEGGVDGLIGRLSARDTRERLKQEVLAGMEKGARRFSDILLAAIASERNRIYEGLNVEEAAAKAGKEPIDFVFDLVVEEHAGVAVVSFGMSEEDVTHIMAHPLTMIGSDGGAMPIDGPGKPHPRTFNTFVRVLAKYCLKDGLFPLEEAVRKMTSFPATMAKLQDRGIIRPGFAADLVLLNLDTLKDSSDYANPRQAPQGVDMVWVNGRLAVSNGRITGVRAGQVIRSNIGS
jgi:N-acyl-D-amino-acid deacylase